MSEPNDIHRGMERLNSGELKRTVDAQKDTLTLLRGMNDAQACTIQRQRDEIAALRKQVEDLTMALQAERGQSHDLLLLGGESDAATK